MTDSRLYDDDDIESVEISAIEAKRQARQQALINADNIYKQTQDRLESAETRLQLAEKEAADAIDNNDGEKWRIYNKLTEEAKEEVLNHRNSLHQQKKNYDNFISRNEWEGDESVTLRAKNFAKKHGLSQDDIDQMHHDANQLIAQGYDPRTTRYWRELEKRLPNKSDDDEENYSSKKSSKSESKKSKFVLTDKHKEALHQMGIFDIDSPEAQKYIKAWANWKDDSDWVQVGG